MKREFFSVRTVAEAQLEFRPARRTPGETVALEAALGRVSAETILSPHELPGFERSAVDGFAVRAADTFGSSEAIPVALELRDEVVIGTSPTVEVGPGEAAPISTGAPMPAGADAVVMVEHTSASRAGSIDVLRAAAPGEAVVRADEDVSSGTPLVGEGARLRPEHLGLLAAAGVVSLSVRSRPRVAIVSTGDELVDPAQRELAPGQVRDATASALAGLVQGAGGLPVPCGIVPDDPAALRATLAEALERCDLVVVSAGSSVGARDATAEVVASLGPPGIWCHGLALKPGKPTLLAQCGDVPVLGLPGNPASALVAFRLLGDGLVRQIGGDVAPPSPRTVRATLARDLPSAAGRLDVVQVALEDGRAEPLFAKSSALSALTRADGQLIVAEELSGLYEGSEVVVELHG